VKLHQKLGNKIPDLGGLDLRENLASIPSKHRSIFSGSLGSEQELKRSENQKTADEQRSLLNSRYSFREGEKRYKKRKRIIRRSSTPGGATKKFKEKINTKREQAQ